MPVRRPVCLICLLFLFIIYIVSGGGGPAPSWDVDSASGKTVTAVGRVADRQEKNGTFQVYLTNVSFKTDQAYFPERSKGIVVKLTDPGQGAEYVRIGSEVEARGIFAPFDTPGCEGMFDTRKYYMIRGYEGQLKRARLTGVSRGHARISEGLRRIRDRAVGILQENMSGEDAGLVAAMTLGDKSGLDSEIKELYQRAGISHVLALSGLHIASVGLAILRLLKKSGMPPKAASAASFSVIVVYAVMTGLSTSTVRAMIMFGLFVLAGLCGRTYDLLSGAAVSALIILAMNKSYIYDTGFLLSFGAVLGIACIFPVFDSLPGTFLPKPPKEGAGRKIYQSLCISLSVTVATFPVMGAGFMQISVYSVVINLIVIPLMGLVLFTGFAGMIIGSVGIPPSFILKITHYILKLFEFLGDSAEAMPGNLLVIGKPAKWQAVTYVIIVAAAILVWNITFYDNTGFLRGRAAKKTRDRSSYSIETEADRQRNMRKKRAGSLITLVMFLAAAFVFMLHLCGTLEIRNVDVGQGDCTLIWGKGLETVVIDGGSSDVKEVGKNRILPVLKANRITRVDKCFLTHMDSDHVNGMIEILEDGGCGIKIRQVVISPNAASGDDESGNLEKLLGAAKRSGTKVSLISAGNCLDIGDDARLVCISPPKGGAAGPGGNNTDENENSIVLRLEYVPGKGLTPFYAMFTGDIGESAEKGMLGFIQDCTYLKVAHHGSRNSSSAAFLKKADPEISVISAGVNTYGHPHAETLDRLMEAGSRIYCTKESGEIIVEYDDGRLCVETVRGR